MLLRISDLFFHCVSRALHEPSCSVLYAALDSLIKVHLWRMLVKKMASTILELSQRYPR